MNKIVVWAAGFLVVVVALGAAAYWYALSLPGKSFTGPLPPPTRAEEDLAQRLQRHVTAIASVPHNVSHPDALDKSAAYIEGELKALGYTPLSQVYDTDGKSVRNIEIVLAPAGAGPEIETIVVGAHYDSAGVAPGANDNATGVAAALEIASVLKDVPLKTKALRIVLFVNEEPPYDRTPYMGSVRYAHMLKDQNVRVAGMMSLETLGCFSDEPGSQKYPAPFGLIFPNKANFIAFVAMPGSRSFLHDVVGELPQAHRLPDHRRHRARSGRRHRLVGPLVVLAARLSGGHGDGHRALPLSRTTTSRPIRPTRSTTRSSPASRWGSSRPSATC